MGVAKILFCAGPDADSAAAKWLAPVLAAWPSREVARAQRVDLVRLLGRAEQGLIGPEDLSLHEGATVCLLMVLDGSEDPSRLAKLFDAVQGMMQPAVVVAPHEDAVRAIVQQHGVIAVGDRTTSTEIAAMVFALCERQPLVDQLGREVRTGTGMEKGIRGEMNRLHEELHLAATVQRELLPHRLPEDEFVEFASMYLPATYVSGDLFDARAIDENRIVFFIADAVGHGVPAALITMMLSRGLLNQFAHGARGDISPADCLRGLNCELCHHASGNYRFATAVCGVLDKRDFSVKLAGAGHPPTLLLHRGKMTSIESQGPLLGVFAEAEYSDDTVMLEPGATLLLYTDGFELAFPAPGEEIKDRRVAPREYLNHMNLLDASENACSVREGMDRLARAMAGQEGSLHQRDDVTALAMRRLEAVEMRRAA